MLCILNLNISSSISPGLIVTYNVKKPVGQRLVSVNVRCAECSVPVFEPLDKARKYMVIIPQFLINGGDYFSMIKPNVLERHIAGKNNHGRPLLPFENCYVFPKPTLNLIKQVLTYHE
jgi:hypothetical protein